MVLNLIYFISVSLGQTTCWRTIIIVIFSIHHSSLTCFVLNVAIRGSGVDHLIKLPPQTTSCCRLPLWIFYLLSVALSWPLGLFWWLIYTPRNCIWSYFKLYFLFFLIPRFSNSYVVYFYQHQGAWVFTSFSIKSKKKV